MATLKTYSVRYVHRISPSDRDVGPDVILDLTDLPLGRLGPETRKALAAQLRAMRVLAPGVRVREARHTQGQLVVFPTYPGLTSYWHSVILTEKVEV